MIKSIGGGVWKLIQTHIVMMIFGVMVYLPVGVETKSRQILTLIFSIFTIIFYYYLIDLYMWDVGARDAVSARGAGTKPSPLKGFVAGLFAAIPDLVLGILFLVFNTLREFSEANTGYNVANLVFALITQTWEGMFMGVRAAARGFISSLPLSLRRLRDFHISAARWNSPLSPDRKSKGIKIVLRA